jgi:dolichyl-phosphate-mannose-protein mannosyltransferase
MSGSLPIDGPGAKLRKHEGGWLLVIILGGLALRLSLLPFEGRPADISDFVGWTLTIERFGTHEFYAHATAVGGRVVDYPPGYLWVLTLIGRLDTILHAHGASNHAALRWIVKLPAIVADLGAALVVFALARRTWTSRQALLAAAILTFSPSTWLISAYWGQVDSVPAFALLLALFFGVSRRYPLAWLALAIAVFVKPQPVVVAPLLLVWQIRDQGWSARLLVSLAVGFAVAYAGSLPFARSAAPVATISWLLNRYRDATQLYPFTSVSAFNLYTVRGGFFEPDARVIGGLSVAAWGIVLFTVLLAIVLVAFRRALYDGRPLRAYEPLFFTAVFATLSALFVVTTRMHERYLFGALVLTPLLILVGRWERSVAIVLTTTFTIDCVLVLSRLTVEPYPRGLSAVIHVLSLLNVAALAVLIVRLAATRSPARALPNCS